MAEEQKTHKTTEETEKDKLLYTLQQCNSLDDIPAVYAALLKDADTTERLMQANDDGANTLQRSFLSMLSRVLMKVPWAFRMIFMHDTTPYYHYKRLIAWALMHDWVSIEIMGCRLAFIPLFAKNFPEYIAWMQNELNTNEELSLQEHTLTKYHGFFVPQWAYRLQRRDVAQFCWEARMLNGQRFFGDPDQWFTKNTPTAVGTSDFLVWWSETITRQNFRRI